MYGVKNVTYKPIPENQKTYREKALEKVGYVGRCCQNTRERLRNIVHIRQKSVKRACCINNCTTGSNIGRNL